MIVMMKGRVAVRKHKLPTRKSFSKEKDYKNNELCAYRQGKLL